MLTVWIGADTDIDTLVCYFTTASEPPTGGYGISATSQVVRFERLTTEWDTLAWGYLTRWQATLPGQPDRTIVQYRIGGWGAGQPEVFADFPDATGITEAAANAFFSGRDWSMPAVAPSTVGKVFAYRVGQSLPPQWARDAIIYQVLVDRFYPGDGRDWLQTADPGQPMGGTLFGVRDRLGYLADLGINTIWLSPTWVSESAHGYDAIDYRTTAARLGGDRALHDLIEAAHRREIRIMLDLPCNHISNQHPIFADACASPDSRYHDWFLWDTPPHGYATFFGVASMPKVNLDHPAARDWMIDTACYWLREFEIDGYRLDYASGPSPDFWTYFGAACKDTRPDCFCFGEVIDTPEKQGALIGRLDGCLDFYTNEALRKTFGWKTQSVAAYTRQTERHRAHFPPGFLMPTFIDNHDMNRFLHIAGGDKEALRAALAAQMSLAAPPILYYGTEVGLSHTVSVNDAGLDIGRVAMIWDERQDRQLRADVAALIHGRAAQ